MTGKRRNKQPYDASLQVLLGPAPLIEGEDPESYSQIKRLIRGAVEPRDFLEEIWTRDVIDLVWETMRYRRLKKAYLDAVIPDGLIPLLRTITGNEPKIEVVIGWMKREPESTAEVDDALEQVGMSRDSALAKALAIHIDQIERMDRLVANCELRRNLVLREIDRKREAFRIRLEQTALDVEDAEFRALETPQAAE